MAFISVNFLTTTCSSKMKDEDKRSTLLVNWGIALALDDACRSGLTLEISGSGWETGPVIIGRVVYTGAQTSYLDVGA